jgi:hypothetical protein
MIQLDVRGIDAVRAALAGVSEQIPYILKTAINSAAFAAMRIERKEMDRVFDNPAPWLTRQVRVTPATKETLTAIVNFQTPKAAAIVAPHVESGARGIKPYERVLQSMGALPAGMRAVPADNIKGANGDPTKATVNRIIQGLRAGKGSGYFVIRPGRSRGLPPGIWLKRKGDKLKPQFLFYTQVKYQKRFEFVGVGEAEARRVLLPAVEAAIVRAMRARH